MNRFCYITLELYINFPHCGIKKGLFLLHIKYRNVASGGSPTSTLTHLSAIITEMLETPSVCLQAIKPPKKREKHSENMRGRSPERGFWRILFSQSSTTS